MKVGDEVRGTIVRWVTGKGRPFGFARVRGEAADLFVPGARLLNAMELREGDAIVCEIRMDREGRFFGDNVEALDGPDAA